MEGRLPVDQLDTQNLGRTADAAKFLAIALRQGIPRDAQMQALLRRHMPMPAAVLDEGVLQVVFRGDREAYDRAVEDGTLASIAERSFYNDIGAYDRWLGSDGSFDSVALAADLEAVVVAPLRAMEKLFTEFPYLTRLYTTLSAHEMTVGPMFGFNPDLPQVSNLRRADARWECVELDEQTPDLTQLALIVTLRDGREIRSRPFVDGPWPLARESQQPAAALVEQLDTSGPPTVIQRLTAVGVEPSPALPTGFDLHQSYPNPFNAATVIPFTVPSRIETHVQLTIHDVLGQHIRTLVSGLRMASGVYLVRMEAGSKHRSQKIMYLR